MVSVTSILLPCLTIACHFMRITYLKSVAGEVVSASTFLAAELHVCGIHRG